MKLVPLKQPDNASPIFVRGDRVESLVRREGVKVQSGAITSWIEVRMFNGDVFFAHEPMGELISMIEKLS